MNDDLSPEFKAQFAPYYGRHFFKVAVNMNRCAGRTGDGSQCGRAHGYGPHGAWCKQHDPVAVEARRNKRHQEWDSKWKAERENRAREEREAAFRKDCEDAVREIAGGHNNPADLCREIIARFEEGK